MVWFRRRTIPATLATLALMTAISTVDVLLGDARALAGPVNCGDTITADTTLDVDLADCPNHGIVIGADDITLDLNGHTIDGDGEAFEACVEDEICDVGVLNDGHDGVTVTDGSVQEFGFGLLVTEASGNRIVGVVSSSNLLFGIVLDASAGSIVRDSAGDDNPAPDGDGLALFESHRIRIIDNSFSRNGLGMHIEDSTNNVIKGNVFAQNEQPGVLVQADGNEIRGNRCRRNGMCFLVAGNRNVIARNHAQGDIFGGIAVEDGHHNVIAHNVVERTRSTGIYLGVREFPAGGARNVVRWNVVERSDDDAFLVTSEDRHSVVKHNTARDAGDDGFDIQSRSVRLTGNRAFRNADLGIQAVEGVIDGGGNVARGNGDPRQCTHIACR